MSDRKKDRKQTLFSLIAIHSLAINYRKTEKGIIIDSHLSHYLPKRHVDLCIVTKCNLKELESRLRNKKYSKDKIRENLDAEICDVCLSESKEKGHKVLVVDTTKGINIEKIMEIRQLWR